MFPLGKQGGRIAHLAFAPDCQTLATVGEATIKLWDLAERRIRTNLRGIDNIEQAVFASDGETLAGFDDSGTVQVWETETGRVCDQRRVAAPDVIYGLAYVADSNTLSLCLGRTVGEKTEVEIAEWDLDADTWQPRLQWHLPDLTHRLAVDLVRRRLVALVGPGPDRLLLCGSGAGRKHVPLPTGDWHSVSLSPDGIIVAVRSPRILTFWDPESPKRQVIVRQESRINDFALSPDGRLALTAGNDSLVHLYDLTSGQQRTAFDWRIKKVDAVTFAPDGMTAAAGSHDGRIIVWDVDES